MRVPSISFANNAYLREAAAPARFAGSTAEQSAVSPSSDTKVSISKEAAALYAKEAAAAPAKEGNSAGYKLPDGWIRTSFPDDIMAEAEALLAERRAAPDQVSGTLPSGVHGLPMLPENEQLLQKIRAEMRELSQDLSDPAKHKRYNELMNLTIPLMANGWAKPMTEADLVRDREISQAMGLIQSRSEKPADPGAQTVTQADQAPSAALDPLSGWKRRWKEDGLTMPPITFKFDPGQSIWLDMAKEAGIGTEEFLRTAREFAQSSQGEALTKKVEGFISDRYAALLAARQA